MNNILFFLLFLGICFSIYNKYDTVIENLKCDPNKPKVYPEDRANDNQKWTNRCYGGLNGNSACKKDLGKGWVGTGKEKGCKGTLDARYQCRRRSGARCQKLRQIQNTKNLKDFKKELYKVRIEMNKTNEEFLKLWNEMLENMNNIKKADGEGDGEEVDLSGDNNNSIRDSQKVPKPTFKI